jgi:post-segregation antitoxin (ccd killing protein)
MARGRARTGIDRQCANCGATFYVPGWHLKDDPKFCSMDCLWAGRKPRAKKQKVQAFCEECGEPYLVQQHRASETRFCSKRCHGAFRSREMNVAKRPPATSDASSKICSTCGEEKPRSEFYARPLSESSDGLRANCKACHDARHRDWMADPANYERKIETDRARWERESERINRENREQYAINPEPRRKKNKKWRDENPEKVSAANRQKRRGPQGDALRQRRREHYRQNKPRYVAQAAARTERNKRATPPWADLKAIEQFYWEADRLTKLTGIKHHVDHIYPLQSKVMCGLHVEANLCVVPWNVNLEKGNKVVEPIPASEARCCAWPTAALLPGTPEKATFGG